MRTEVTLYDALRETTSTACDAFMRKMGKTYPWLHPEFDPKDAGWRWRAKVARKRLRGRVI